MILEQQLKEAAFWGSESICLTCGATWEEGEEVERCCNQPILVSPTLALAVLTSVERDDDGGTFF